MASQTNLNLARNSTPKLNNLCVFMMNHCLRNIHNNEPLYGICHFPEHFYGASNVKCCTE